MSKHTTIDAILSIWSLPACVRSADIQESKLFPASVPTGNEAVGIPGSGPTLVMAKPPFNTMSPRSQKTCAFEPAIPLRSTL